MAGEQDITLPEAIEHASASISSAGAAPEILGEEDRTLVLLVAGGVFALRDLNETYFQKFARSVLTLNDVAVAEAARRRKDHGR